MLGKINRMETKHEERKKKHKEKEIGIQEIRN